MAYVTCNSAFLLISNNAMETGNCSFPAITHISKKISQIQAAVIKYWVADNCSQPDHNISKFGVFYTAAIFWF